MGLPGPDVFWQSWDVRQAADEQWERRLQELQEEKRAVMQQLLGSYWNADAYEFWYDDPFGSIAEIASLTFPLANSTFSIAILILLLFSLAKAILSCRVNVVGCC